MGSGIGGIVDKVKGAVRQVAKTVEKTVGRAAEQVSKKINEMTHPAIRAHRGEDGFDRPGPLVQSRDRPGGPTVYKPGDGPNVA